MATAPFIRRLPIHVIRLVLSRLDTIQSLGSAILSHSIFYTAFTEDTPGIIADILTSQMDTRLLPFARAVYEAADISNIDLSKVWTFLDNRLHPRNPDATDWAMLEPFQLSPTVAAAISKFHVVVQYFTNDFVRRAVRSGDDPHKLRHGAYRMSATECFRVQRSLYRFQLYCCLFYRNTSDLRPDSARRQEIEYLLHMTYFHHFAQWENEQLACIHDYLERVLSDAFDEVAALDVTWGAHRVDWLSVGMHNKCKQAYLSLGLPFLQRLSQARTYQQRRLILTTTRYKPNNLPPETDFMLAKHFQVGHEFDDFDFDPALVPLKRLTTRQASFLVRGHSTFREDNLTSWPFRMWILAHRRLTIIESLHFPDYRAARAYGYVIWDNDEDLTDRQIRSRLAKMRDKYYDEEDDRQSKFRPMEDSWEARRLLLQCQDRKGQRGNNDAVVQR